LQIPCRWRAGFPAAPTRQGTHAKLAGRIVFRGVRGTNNARGKGQLHFAAKSASPDAVQFGNEVQLISIDGAKLNCVEDAGELPAKEAVASQPGQAVTRSIRGQPAHRKRMRPALKGKTPIADESTAASTDTVLAA